MPGMKHQAPESIRGIRRRRVRVPVTVPSSPSPPPPPPPPVLLLRLLWVAHLGLATADAGLRAAGPGGLPDLARVYHMYHENTATKAFNQFDHGDNIELQNKGFLGYRIGDIVNHPDNPLADLGHSWARHFCDVEQGRRASVACDSNLPAGTGLNVGELSSLIWPESLGALYAVARMRCHLEMEKPHMPLLIELARRRCPLPPPRGQGQLVVHVRIGDIIPEGCANLSACGCRWGRCYPSVAAAETTARLLQKSQFKNHNVMVIAGIHRVHQLSDGGGVATQLAAIQESVTVSTSIVRTVARAFEAHGFNTSVQSLSPDCDFCALVQADAIIEPNHRDSRSSFIQIAINARRGTHARLDENGKDGHSSAELNMVPGWGWDMPLAPELAKCLSAAFPPRLQCSSEGTADPAAVPNPRLEAETIQLITERLARTKARLHPELDLPEHIPSTTNALARKEAGRVNAVIESIDGEIAALQGRRAKLVADIEIRSNMQH